MRKVCLTTFPLFWRTFVDHGLFRFDRYFETDNALQSHWRGKVHKRRCKALKDPAYTIEESERAAGLGREGKRSETSNIDVVPMNTSTT